MSRRDARLMFAICLACAMPAGAAEPCAPVNDAVLKLAQTPNHSFTRSSGAIAGGKVKQSERITTATASYILASGKWHRSVMTPQQELRIQKEAMEEKKNGSCRYLRDEVVEGEPAALYATHEEDDGGRADGQIWISRRRGLPIKQVLHVSVGGGTIGESEVMTRYVYDNARAPENVQ